MPLIIGLAIFGIPATVIAISKGFKYPLRWLLSFGIIGLIIVAILPSAHTTGISDDEAAVRIAKGDKIGGILCGLCVGLCVLVGLIALGK